MYPVQRHNLMGLICFRSFFISNSPVNCGKHKLHNLIMVRNKAAYKSNGKNKGGIIIFKTYSNFGRKTIFNCSNPAHLLYFMDEFMLVVLFQINCMGVADKYFYTTYIKKSCEV